MLKNQNNIFSPLINYPIWSTWLYSTFLRGSLALFNEICKAPNSVPSLQASIFSLSESIYLSTYSFSIFLLTFPGCFAIFLLLLFFCTLKSNCYLPFSSRFCYYYISMCCFYHPFFTYMSLGSNWLLISSRL